MALVADVVTKYSISLALVYLFVIDLRAAVAVPETVSTLEPRESTTADPSFGIAYPIPLFNRLLLFNDEVFNVLTSDPIIETKDSRRV
jgi:hypothetical protein